MTKHSSPIKVEDDSLDIDVTVVDTSIKDMSDENSIILDGHVPNNRMNMDHDDNAQDRIPNNVPQQESLPKPDLQTNRFTWRVERFSMLRDKIYSDVYDINGFKWRLLLFPVGNNNPTFVSLFLDVADKSALQLNWIREASFSLRVISQTSREHSIQKETRHKFTLHESDWGFNHFAERSVILDESKGLLLNDTMIIEAYIQHQCDVNPYQPYDSKKETGFVGLKNQGATCYMNSLLQTLYHLPCFRQAVYHIPTIENENASKSIPLALQSLFYKMQFSDQSPATKDLTRSFGWDTYDSFTQHDVLEFNHVLCEKLEDKMKSTPVQGTMENLFECKILNYIECVNVECTSEREETVRDLQLVVKGCKDIYQSFDKFCEVEMLDGDNKYRTERFGLQDARKGIKFKKFPPVLELHLLRFEYDFQRDMMIKVNDKYEFPSLLDLDIENGKYFARNAEGRQTRNLYRLHSVLVHSGGVHGGHYYAYIRPDSNKNEWFKFDDEKVTKEDERTATIDQYGEDESDQGKFPSMNRFGKYSNAYMLVYVRECDIENLFCEVEKKDIAEHLQARFQKEHEERERKMKEKAEAHLYTSIKLARNEDIKNQIGKSIVFDLVNHEHVKNFRVQKQLRFVDFKILVEREFGVPVDHQRYWLWAKRQNHTFRPCRVLQVEEENQPVGEIREGGIKNYQSTELKLFLEVVPSPVSMFPVPREHILLFFKFYSPMTKSIEYIGHMFVPFHGKIQDIRPKLREMGNLEENVEVLAFEEIKFDPVMCEVLDWRSTFSKAQLENGDIICFQEACPENVIGIEYPTVVNFMEYSRNKVLIRFRQLEDGRSAKEENDLTVELRKDSNYDAIVSALALKLNLEDPTCLRLSPFDTYSQLPKAAIKYRGVEKLSELLVHFAQSTDIIYYEILSMPLPDLEQMKTFRVAFFSKGTNVNYEISVRSQDSVSTILSELKDKLPPDRKVTNLRLLDVSFCRIIRIFEPTDGVEVINDRYANLRVDEIEEGELSLGENDRFIHFYHFKNESNGTPNIQLHGDPLLLGVREGDTLSDVKETLKERLCVSDKDLSSWSFYCVCTSPMGTEMDPLNDEDLLINNFLIKLQSGNATMGKTTMYVGMEHDIQPLPKSQQANNNNRYGYERPVKIYT